MRLPSSRSLKSALAAGAALIAANGAPAATMNWPDLLDRPRPAADRRIAYGADPLQHVDLWLPQGQGPHPVVLMVHGGCWQTEVAQADIMNYIAADLRGHGIAVWNIEYRGVDRPGGGYPGTFLDVAAAADALRARGPRLGLKVERVVAFGSRPRARCTPGIRSRAPARSASAAGPTCAPRRRRRATPAASRRCGS